MFIFEFFGVGNHVSSRFVSGALYLYQGFPMISVQCSFFINIPFFLFYPHVFIPPFFFSEKMSTDAEIQNGAAEVAANVRA